ncbi:MAG: SRPBCC domain-containing protein [Propionibacteriaceae bacterium]|jgi:hypothetical protein|nr:SRPBCC domain-containing protein [Propionibacteriaceae bacterium]
MMSSSTSVVIEASPEEVWAVLTDLPDYQRWNPVIRHIWGELTVGGRVSFDECHPGGLLLPLNVTSRVENAELSWRKGPLGGRWIFQYDHRVQLQPDSQNPPRTVVTQTDQLSGALAIFTPIGSLRKDSQRVGAALKVRTEALNRADGGPLG